MIVKAAWLFDLKSRADEGPVLSTEVWLALISYAPASKNLEGHTVFYLFIFVMIILIKRLQYCGR